MVRHTRTVFDIFFGSWWQGWRGYDKCKQNLISPPILLFSVPCVVVVLSATKIALHVVQVVLAVADTLGENISFHHHPQKKITQTVYKNQKISTRPLCIVSRWCVCVVRVKNVLVPRKTFFLVRESHYWKEHCGEQVERDKFVRRDGMSWFWPLLEFTLSPPH